MTQGQLGRAWTGLGRRPVAALRSRHDETRHRGLGDFLDLPYTAVLATHWADGSILLSPVWHEWRDGGFNIGVPEDDVKVEHIARDPRVTVVVYEQSWPSRSVEVRGIATVTREGREELSRRLSVRYLGAGQRQRTTPTGRTRARASALNLASSAPGTTSTRRRRSPTAAARLIPLVVTDAQDEATAGPRRNRAAVCRPARESGGRVLTANSASAR